MQKALQAMPDEVLRDMGYGMWDVGYGIWDMGYGIWDMGYGNGTLGGYLGPPLTHPNF